MAARHLSHDLLCKQLRLSCPHCLQVYAFGAVSIIMGNASNSIRARLGDRWVPVTLEQLVAENAKRATRQR